MSEYSAKLLDDRWRSKRLYILERDVFTCRNCGVSGVDLEVHHLRYLPGKDPWESPNDDLVTLCVRCHNDVTVENENAKMARQDPNREIVRRGLREMISLFSSRKAAFPSKPKPIGFEADRAWNWIRGFLPDQRLQRPMMKFAGWLWSSGLHDMDAILILLEDRCRKNPESPYAYYAPGSDARSCIVDQLNISRAEAENERIKQEEREWLVVNQRPRP